MSEKAKSAIEQITVNEGTFENEGPSLSASLAPISRPPLPYCLLMVMTLFIKAPPFGCCGLCTKSLFLYYNYTQFAGKNQVKD